MEYKGKKIEDYTNEDFNGLDSEEQMEFLWIQMDIAMSEIREEEAAAAEAAKDEELQAWLDDLFLRMESGEWDMEASSDED